MTSPSIITTSPSIPTTTSTTSPNTSTSPNTLMNPGILTNHYHRRSIPFKMAHNVPHFVLVFGSIDPHEPALTDWF